ncbi:hypothetical protein I551_8235 [Mycobacterium ulcerans str. Harvey]|uniref:Uncharacterized protein n=1 Tax=Mycobacterium ulcerans str. Harvey TaxID=1299332 RepID=A0ABN0QKZ1_MYCUL|nr:hypothetical protein I551_8235 [Mycobacterium ulcerans str. Harvey]
MRLRASPGRAALVWAWRFSRSAPGCPARFGGAVRRRDPVRNMAAAAGYGPLPSST